MKRCKRCCLPETHETIVFDQDGVCNVCRQIEQKQLINWEQREIEFKRLLEQYRGKYLYDCLVPFSGGKDSTYTLYTLVHKFGLRPLVVTFDHGFFRPRTLDNQLRAINQLGVDWVRYRLNETLMKRVMLESIKRKGDFCWHCHCGCFCYPMWVAIQYKVPLVIWGEPSAEYTAYFDYNQHEKVDEHRFNRFVNLGIAAQDMANMVGVDERELHMLTFPPASELNALRASSICLGSYFPWNAKAQALIIKSELGWSGDVVEGVPPDFDYDKVECAYVGVRDYLKVVKRGFGRTAHLMAIELRNNRISQKEAWTKIQTYDGKRPDSLSSFLQFLGLSEKEFMKIAIKQQVSPWNLEYASHPTHTSSLAT